MDERFDYKRTCSRCNGTGRDPEIANCACDCCVDGEETLWLTEAEAEEYPGAVKVKQQNGKGHENG